MEHWWLVYHTSWPGALINSLARTTPVLNIFSWFQACSSYWNSTVWNKFCIRCKKTCSPSVESACQCVSKKRLPLSFYKQTKSLQKQSSNTLLFWNSGNMCRYLTYIWAKLESSRLSLWRIYSSVRIQLVCILQGPLSGSFRLKSRDRLDIHLCLIKLPAFQFMWQPFATSVV